MRQQEYLSKKQTQCRRNPQHAKADGLLHQGAEWSIPMTTWKWTWATTCLREMRARRRMRTSKRKQNTRQPRPAQDAIPGLPCLTRRLHHRRPPGPVTTMSPTGQSWKKQPRLPNRSADPPKLPVLCARVAYLRPSPLRPKHPYYLLPNNPLRPPRNDTSMRHLSRTSPRRP